MSDKKTNHEGQTSTKQHNSDYVEIKLPKIKKPNISLSPFNAFLIILLVIVSFIAGSLYTKNQYLEQGGFVAGTDTGKVASSLSEAFMGYAKKAGLDTKKFQACFAKNKYAAKVTADQAQANELGTQATPNFFINGVFLGGAYPVESFKEIIDQQLTGNPSQNYKDYSQTLQQAYESQQQSFNPIPKQIEVGNAPIRGDKNAKITIVEFSDFQCPFCNRSYPTMKQILQDYKGKVRLVYKHLPIPSLHPNAQKAAEASECANEQGKFWEFHDQLFENQTTWSTLPQTTPSSNI